MKKLSIIAFVIVLFMGAALAQQRQKIDSLIRELSKNKPDSQRIETLIQLNSDFWESDLDSSLDFGQQALRLAQQTENLEYISLSLQRIGGCYRNLGDYPKSLDYFFRALKIAADNNYREQEINILGDIAKSYESLKDYPKAISYFQQAFEVSREIQSAGWITMLEAFIGAMYSGNNQLDLASFYMQNAFIGIDTLANKYLEKTIFADMGILQFKKGEHENAFQNVHRSILINKIDNSHRGLAIAYNSIADFFRQLNRPDSGIFYADMGLKEAQANGFREEILKSLKMLAELYETTDLKKSLFYYKEASKVNDELFGAEKNNNLQKTLAEEQERQRQAESESIAYRNQLKQYAFLAGLVILFVIAFILYRNNLHRKKANALLQTQKEKIELQKVDLEQTLDELRTTQGQLVQSAKMASLGELTAGIAHEIQNPLNFVNNFSDVNNELIEEANQEINKGNLDEAKAILSTLKDNQQKINEHGKRADTIVKGMLQHSRTSSGKKEPTNFNALADEYLRLAYHGLRAKDKSFNAEIKTDFDETIEKLNVVPQDIGRVLLNLYNNAFYAVSEKAKHASAGSAGQPYEPTVTISTKKVADNIELKVIDNGNGIPQKILDKIFQPFFTTKPTGQGTGLGLSLSYDIIKAQGGEIKVNTKEGEGSEFIIQLRTS